jgi:hypothetical protein
MKTLNLIENLDKVWECQQFFLGKIEGNKRCIFEYTKYLENSLKQKFPPKCFEPKWKI